MVSGEFIHYLDDVVVEEPGKWEEFTEELERSWDLRLIAVQYPNQVVFNRGGYAYLRSLYEGTLCTSLTYRCEFVCGNQTYVVARGQLNISDIEWNLNKCEANAKIADDGFGARINNNKSIKVSMGAITSKNGVDIGACPTVDLEVFDPADPEPDYLVNPAIAYDWLEALNHNVRFITDDAITVESDWYNSLPEDERFTISLGREFRTRNATSEAPEVSFVDLFENVWKKYNLWAVVRRGTDGSPILSIMQDAETFAPGVSLSLPHQDDLEQSVDLDRMYSSVKLGDKDYYQDENTSPFVLPILPMVGFRPEEYYISGTCNTDTQLNLEGTFVYDNNAVNACRGGVEDYDDKIILVQYTPYTSQATKGSYLFPDNNPFLYNEAFLNLNVANRWKLQASGVTNYDAPEAEFAATRTASIPNPTWVTADGNSPGADTEQVLQFDDDYTPPNFDNDNSWGNGTAQGTPVSQANSRYTAPSVGYYVFEGFATWELISSNIGAQSQGTICQKKGYLTILVKRFNVSNTLIGTTTYNSDEESIPGIYGITFNYDSVLNAGDYIVVYSVLKSTGVDALCPFPPFASYILRSRLADRSSFATTAVATGGGVIVGSDPDEYRTINYKWERFIPIEDWVVLREDATQGVNVATDATSFRFGHVDKFSRNILTGLCECELVANRQQTFK